MVRIVTFLTLKFGSKPIGVWFAWIALAWGLGIALRESSSLFGMCSNGCLPGSHGLFISWFLLTWAIVSLFRRRLISITFSGMALVSVIQGQIAECCPFSVVLAVLGFVGLLANRRWFDENLPRIGR